MTKSKTKGLLKLPVTVELIQRRIYPIRARRDDFVSTVKERG